MNHVDVEQLVLNQMNRDPAKHHGVKTIQYKVAFDAGVHLTRHGPFETRCFSVLIG
jgi:hypothetical protein